VDRGERYGIPVLAVTAVGKEMTRDARYLGLACRIAAELGARFVKTYYCEGFEEVVRSTPRARGHRAEGRKCRSGMLSPSPGTPSAREPTGVRPWDMGTSSNSDSPVGMIRAIRAVVHDSASVDAAW
jgi:putative autoinducer-2 (AI-2) aldolase